MKSLEVKQQVRLGFVRCAELVLNGVKYRLFRAAITVVIVALAVAFLVTMLSESLTARRVAAIVDAQTAPRRMLLLWTSRISVPINEMQLAEEFSAAVPASQAWEEFSNWGGLDEAEMASLKSVASKQLQYLGFFEELSEGQKSVLLGRARGMEVFPFLQAPGNFEQFVAALSKLGLQSKLPAGVDGLQSFMQDWQTTEPLRERILQGHREALEQVKGILRGRQPKEFLAEADEALLGRLSELGYRLPVRQLPIVREQAAFSLDAGRITQLLSVQKVRQRLAGRIGVDAPDVNAQMLFAELSSYNAAEWLVGLIADSEEIDSRGLTPERVQQVARNRLDEARLAKIEASVSEAAGDKGPMGFSPRTMWLIIVSMLVCVVGIANAMLMSVTERFREIATMKCLGATDRFIMTSFVLESCLQGTAGGLIGATLGFLLGTVRSWAKYGWMAITHLPAMEIFSTSGLSVVVGIILSALAAVYPAWVASRLAPMEAMRIE